MTGSRGGDLSVLRRIRAARPTVTPAAARCDLCGEAVAAGHGHVVDLRDRSLRCACPGCWQVLGVPGAGGSRYRAVPERYLAVDSAALGPGRWSALEVPVGVAFFFLDSAHGRVTAFYPGPAGATESLLPLTAWEDLVGGHPALAGLQPDVEALLVRGEPGREVPELFVVPIDACYELVGELRACWQGVDGGAGVRAALDAFFGRVRARAHRPPPARPPGPPGHGGGGGSTDGGSTGGGSTGGGGGGRHRPPPEDPDHALPAVTRRSEVTAAGKEG